ncbi:MAG: efflux RND transporter periplasmic adaptor subunit [Candidatus Paceibacterota bacterium]|jgi:HlyD family secretion protein
MKTIFLKLKTWTVTHKKIAIFLLIILSGTVYGTVQGFSDGTAETRYILATVEKGTVVSSLSGTGQVSASNQVVITSKSAGDILYLNAKSGQEVKTGTLIAQIDSGNASYELETAQLSYEKLITIDPTTLAQAQVDLADEYTSARATLISVSTDMADDMEALKDFFDCNTGYLGGCQGYTSSDERKIYRDKAASSWDAADALLEEVSHKYQEITKTSTGEEITSVIADTHETALAVAEAAKYIQDAIVYFRNHADTSSQQPANTAYTAVIPLVSSANATVATLATTKKSIITAQRALDDVQEGADSLDVRSSELSIRQKQEALADYSVRAPFDGIVASVTAKMGENVSNGASIATLITKQKVAELSLNEVDAAQIKVGNKATITFDAIDGLSLTGSVAEVSGIGTVTQGVVSYTVKITFDSQDERIKPGMTVNAAIQVAVRKEVLTVPSSAVKTKNGVSYVQVFTPALSTENSTQGVISSTPPEQVKVTVGISDDRNVEILSGLQESQQIVARAISGTATTNTAPSSTAGGQFGGSGIRL